MALFYLCASFLTLCLLSVTSGLAAQGMPVVNLSAAKKEQYQATLAQHKDMVAFIEQACVNNGLPKLMRNLALVESSFDKTTVSSAKAVGVWQFREEHAAGYGLKSEDRYDVYHSTQIAMKSLKNLYRKYANWITVVAAYNCGEGNVQKAMNKANSNRYAQFYAYLPVETINHVRKFMEACAATGELSLLLADYKLSAFNHLPREVLKADVQPDGTLTAIAINASYSLAIIAEELAIARADLDKWNPQIAEALRTRGAASLYLPIDRMPDFIILQHQILNRSLQNFNGHDE